MNILNAVVRFGVTAEGRIYDYVKKVEVDVVDAYETVDGWWNLHVVKKLVLEGKSIETAFTGNVSVAQPPSASPADTPPAAPSTAPGANLSDAELAQASAQIGKWAEDRGLVLNKGAGNVSATPPQDPAPTSPGNPSVAVRPDSAPAQASPGKPPAPIEGNDTLEVAPPSHPSPEPSAAPVEAAPESAMHEASAAQPEHETAAAAAHEPAAAEPHDSAADLPSHLRPGG